jgi:hypothetical protein
METIIGFAAGYLVGTREGRDGLERLRTSWRSIKTSPEARRLASEALTTAQAVVKRASAGALGTTVGGVADMLARRAAAAASGQRSQAA